MSKKENNRAEIKRKFEQTNSKRSYEIDPTLKDISSNLRSNLGNLREKKESSAQDGAHIFEKLHPPENEISSFAKQVGELPELKADFKTSLNKIAVTFRNAFSNISEYNEVNSQIKELLVENFFHTAKALAIAVEARDPYTGGHSDRVFQISTELGKRCNISATEQLYLEGGALLHDVGKIAVRDGVLLKPGPLTDSEYKEMQLHTIFGSQIVKRMNCLQGCIDAVLLHHERIDGYGYPYGLKGSEIPLIARITSVADAYDAMTTNRIYRKALSHEQALEEILRNSGTQFDPEIVRVFLTWWEDTFQKNPEKSVELYKYTS